MSPPPGAGTTRTAGASRHCSQRCPGRGMGAGGAGTSRTSAMRRGSRRRVWGGTAPGSSPGLSASGRGRISPRPVIWSLWVRGAPEPPAGGGPGVSPAGPRVLHAPSSMIHRRATPSLYHTCPSWPGHVMRTSTQTGDGSSARTSGPGRERPAVSDPAHVLVPWRPRVPSWCGPPSGRALGLPTRRCRRSGRGRAVLRGMR
jgi:hypothetical protein